MSLSRNLTAAVDAAGGPGAAPTLAEAQDGPYRLALDLTAADAVGVAFDALVFSAGDGPARGPGGPRAFADRLAARVTYLLEPLVVVEHDAVSDAVALRSKTPTPRGDLRGYYEVRVGPGGTVRLSRVVFDGADRRRRPASCRLTREALERLADDLVACAGPA